MMWPISARMSLVQVGMSQISLSFRCFNCKNHSSFPKNENHIFILMSLSCSVQIVINALDVWYLGHSKHYFSMIHYKE